MDSSPKSTENIRILIAEDDLTARTILAGILKKWGYLPIAVKDGQAAWDILQQPDSPRLAILDWIMPLLDGLEVIRLARAHYIEQPPYIILLTSKDEKGDILFGLESGANDYIKKPFDHEELLARIRVGLRTIELQTSLYETQQTLIHLATHDPLTSLLNRRAILEQLAKEIARAEREESANSASKLSVGFFDVDNFKQINDRFGHQAGDEVLKGLVATLTSQLRKYDSFGRLGGDEFLVVAPDMDEAGRIALFERLRAAVTTAVFNTCAGEISISMSMGVATASPESSPDQVLNAADTAMYAAKRKGGNCVVYAG